MAKRRTTKRVETNEELMHAAIERYGYLSVRLSFGIKDKEGVYRGVKGKSLVIRKVPSIRHFEYLETAVFDALKAEIAKI